MKAEKTSGEYTFKPKINMKSAEIIGKNKKESILESAQSYMSRKIVKIQERQKLKEQEEVAPCTFHPVINQRSWYHE